MSSTRAGGRLQQPVNDNRQVVLEQPPLKLAGADRSRPSARPGGELGRADPGRVHVVVISPAWRHEATRRPQRRSWQVDVDRRLRHRAIFARSSADLVDRRRARGRAAGSRDGRAG
jgi:hypothetical protein